MPRIVLVSQEAPQQHADNAGVGYLGALVSLLSRCGAQVTVIVPETPFTRGSPRSDEIIRVPVDETARPGVRGFVAEVTSRLAGTRPPRGFIENLRASSAAVTALQQADIVDAQWPMMAAVLTDLQRLAPRARLIATLHDVPSQGNRRQRQRARRLSRWIRTTANTVYARRLERRATRLAQTVIVFSEKDRELLPNRRSVEVVYPPLARVPDHTRPSDSERVAGAYVLFVGPLYREVNRDALQWFAEQVWPHVRELYPNVRLVVAGRSSVEERKSIGDLPGTEFVGFVEDLEPLYGDAAAVVAPLRLGAGVKFKVVDAMVRGVPVIGTAVAFEGIGDGAHMPRATDSADAFAGELSRVLADPQKARRAAREWQTWALARYSGDSFERQMRGIYGLNPVVEDSRNIASRAVDTSVVIPVRNGEHLIAHQLAALARQKEASRVEVVVADNGSTDRTAQVVEAFRSAFADLRVVDASARRGVNHARNVGLQASRGEKVLICDHDDMVRPGWIRALSSALDAADAAGGRAVPFGDARPSPESSPEEDADSSTLLSVLGYLPYAIGCSLAVRRSAALSVGGFDEAFVGGHDEADFCWRLQQAGFTLVAAPTAIVDYRQRSDVRGVMRQWFHSARTRILLLERHKQSVTSSVSFRRALVGAIMATRYVPGLLVSASRDHSARALGWAWGTVAGQVRYGVLGRTPVAQMLPTTSQTDQHG